MRRIKQGTFWRVDLGQIQFIQFNGKNLAGGASMTLASLQEGFGFLRTRGFYAPLFGASHHHRGVIGLTLGLGLHWHGEE